MIDRSLWSAGRQVIESSNRLGPIHLVDTETRTAVCGAGVCPVRGWVTLARYCKVCKKAIDQLMKEDE
jgi:hypothetical protein